MAPHQLPGLGLRVPVAVPQREHLAAEGPLLDRGELVVDEVLRPVSPLAKPPRLSSDALAIFAGVGDRVVPPEHQRDLIEHWKPAAHCWYQGGHLTFRLESAVDGMVRSVLREHLSSAGAPGAAAS